MKKGLTITLLVLLTVGLFVSCNADSIEKLFPEENPPAPETYTVTFDLNGVTGGAAPDTQTISSGEKATNPGDPTFDNHIFFGWYKTKDQITGELSDKWDFATGTVTENTTLFARWVDTTIAGILSTVEKFPASENQITPPSSAWVPDVQNSQKCYAYTATTGSLTALILRIPTVDYTFLLDTTEVTPGENCFTASNNLVTLEFHMADGVLTSFKCTHKEGKTEAFDGTYTAPMATLTMNAGTTNDDWNKITITINKGTGIVSGKYYFANSAVVDAAENLKELVEQSGMELTPEEIGSVNSDEGLNILKEGLEAETEYGTVLVVTNSAGDSQTIMGRCTVGQAPPPM